MRTNLSYHFFPIVVESNYYFASLDKALHSQSPNAKNGVKSESLYHAAGSHSVGPTIVRVGEI